MQRIAVLDALRGLAALTVVLEHCLISLPAFNRANGYRASGKTWVDVFTYTPLHLIWDGHEAVIFFFLLSGFVLTLPFLAGRRLPYPGYLVKRFCRLYIPYVVVVLLSWALLALGFANQPVAAKENGMSSWFEDIWSHPVTPMVLFHYLLMTGKDTHNLDVSSWSLVHEMRISIVFPLLVFALRRLPTILSAPLCAGLIVVASAWYDTIPCRFGATLYYMGFFAFGVLLAKHRQAVRDFIQDLSRKTKAALLIAALLIYNVDWFPAVHNWFGERRPGIDMVIGAAAALVIALATGSRQMKVWIGKRPLVWLGNISFSLYLIHPVVLSGCVYALDGLLPHRWIILLVPPVSIVAAYVMYRLVEWPSIRLGHQFAAAIMQSPQTGGRAA
ncbi:acyltransferase family protein [Alicyclobacillus kakegawensis]|uniref:acyltransferase family protein n=1 Tax=Alicyclobacillus kakegawensis TaxID=392012 RepID=UPI000833120B|nr:acyltransferase [Alicyclobacillus kakegawensis]